MENPLVSPKPTSFSGALFFVWKTNRPYRVYVDDGRIYFIRRAADAMNPAGAAVIGSQFGALGGLAFGVAGAIRAKMSSDTLVAEDDTRPPQELLSLHEDNFVLSPAEILNARIEPAGKYVSFGPNSGRWHFTRKGAEDLVFVLRTSGDRSTAIAALSPLLGDALALPGAEQDETGQALRELTQALGALAPASWQKLRCEIRAAPAGSARPLDYRLGDPDRPAEQMEVDQRVHVAATRLARRLSPSLRSFRGLSIDMTRVEGGGWRSSASWVDGEPLTLNRPAPSLAVSSAPTGGRVDALYRWRDPLKASPQVRRWLPVVALVLAFSMAAFRGYLLTAYRTPAARTQATGPSAVDSKWAEEQKLEQLRRARMPDAEEFVALECPARMDAWMNGCVPACTPSCEWRNGAAVCDWKHPDQDHGARDCIDRCSRVPRLQCPQN